MVRCRDLSGGKSLPAELKDPLGRREILEAMLAEVGERGIDQDAVDDGHQHLAAVTARGDAGSAVDVVSDIALLGDEWRPGVDARPERCTRPLASALGRRRGGGERACGAVGNATKKASPCVSTSTPPWHGARLAHHLRCSPSASA